MDNNKLWLKTVKELTSSLSVAAIKTWFSQCELTAIETGMDPATATINCGSSFSLEQIKVRYLTDLEKALTVALGKECRVKLAVGSTYKKPETRSEPLFLTNQFKPAGNGHKEGLNLNHNFTNFVVGNSNNLAFAAAKAVSQTPGKSYNPLFIYGGVGVGKTHLMQSVGNEILDKFEDAKVIYTTCERFTNDFIESLTAHRSAEFRAKYRKSDALLIDDIQFLSGKESTQEEFFHTFNELHVAQKQIILTSDRHPTEIGRLEDRLVSRFLGGLTVDIGQPDFEMRVAILKFKCKERGVDLKDDVVDFLASMVISNTRELEGSLIQLLSASTALTKPLSVELAKEVFTKQSGGNLKKITSKQIINATCKFFNVNSGDLAGPNRKAFLVKPRQIAMYLLRIELGLPFEEIGAVLGGRDHTTIMYGVEKISQLLRGDYELRKQVSLIKQGLL